MTGITDMHSYATDEDRTAMTVYLAIAAIALGQGIAYLASLGGSGLPRWVASPSTMTLFGVVFWVFNKYAWGWTFRSLRLSKIPDLRGTWAGLVHSSHDDKDNHVVVSINQTWLKISIRLESERSSSASVMAALNTVEAAAEQGLNYEYLNEPVATAVPTMHIHRGTTHLRLSPDRKRLEGSYYTGRDRMNLGTITLQWVAAAPVAREEALKNLPGIQSHSSATP